MLFPINLGKLKPNTFSLGYYIKMKDRGSTYAQQSFYNSAETTTIISESNQEDIICDLQNKQQFSFTDALS